MTSSSGTTERTHHTPDLATFDDDEVHRLRDAVALLYCFGLAEDAEWNKRLLLRVTAAYDARCGR